MTISRAEVITSVERRRRWSQDEKERLVAASLEPGATVSEVHVRAARRDACPGPGLDRANAGFSLERAKKHPRVCDVMKIEPFGKSAVWMYQFWQ